MQKFLWRTVLPVMTLLCALPSGATQLNCDVIPNKVAKLTCQKNQAKIQQMERERAQKKQAAAGKKAEEASYQGRKLYKKDGDAVGHQTRKGTARSSGSQLKDQKKAKRYHKNSHAARMHSKRVARKEAQAKRKEELQKRSAMIAAQTAQKVDEARKSKRGGNPQQFDAAKKNMVQSFKTGRGTKQDGGVRAASDYQDYSGLQVSSQEGEHNQDESLWSYY